MIPKKIWIYYGLLIIFSIVYYYRENARENEKGIERKKLLNSIRSIPPLDALKGFASQFEAISSFVKKEIISAQKATPKKEIIDDGIRLCLEGLISLIQNFQTSYKDTRYAVNIMRFIPIKDIQENEKEKYLNKMERFLECRTLDCLKGVLELVPKLSASTDTEENSLEPDSLLTDLEMALPIPDTTASFNKTPKLLPGAPTAFENEKGNHIVKDTHRLLKIHDESEEYKGISKVIFENIDNYFRREVNDIRSVASFVIKEKKGKEYHKLGVVNIHCDRANHFSDQLTVDNFLALSSPIFIVIAELLQIREK